MSDEVINFFCGGKGKDYFELNEKSRVFSLVPKVFVLLSVSILKCFTESVTGENNCEISKENTSTSSVQCSRVLSIKYDSSKNAELEQTRKLFRV